MIDTKQLLRQKYRSIRDSFGEEFIHQTSKHACENLISSQAFANADTVLLYFPIKNEISPLDIFDVAHRLGKTVAFPLCQKESHTLVFCKVTSLDKLVPSQHGLFEPSNECEIITPDEHTLCIVPALAFSKSGSRLGYGGGYYDRFLANFKGISAGFSYSSLLVDSLPTSEHDIPLDMIITESEVHYFA